MARRSRRSTRPIEDLPSLFGNDTAVDNISATSLQPEAPAADDDDFNVAPNFRNRPEQLRYISFGSGSSGNCSYVGTPSDGILIDAGVDNNKVIKELAANGVDINTIHGIFLTHDHADHVKFAYSILRRNPHMRLFSTLKTLEGLLRRHNISRRIKDYHSPIYKEHEYTFGSITITPFETSHDGTDNCGYHVAMGESALVVATDMGEVTPRADFYIRRATSLVIESNYDSIMLANGRYTEHLKARIRSATGHMDNSVTARYLTEIYTPRLRHIFLCHLSEDNNTPETAVATVLNALRSISILPAASSANIGPGTVYLVALPRFETSDLFII
ncbi:MAG: MBL fold metallo-hydrolase [Odoribacter sp.]|nr:MBL fold metallo-hydrolase [Odoribacter sp.]